MRIRSSSRQRNLLILAAVALLAVVGTYLIYLSLQGKLAGQEEAVKETNSSAKAEYINSDKESTTGSQGLPDNSTATTSDQVPTSSETSIRILSASQVNGMVRADAEISGIGEGTCVFVYQPADNGKPVSRQVDANEKSCSASISQNEFAYLGDWKLTVTYYINGTKAEASQNVTIR